MVPGMIF